MLFLFVLSCSCSRSSSFLQLFIISSYLRLILIRLLLIHICLYKSYSFIFARETNFCQALHKGARPVHWPCPAMPRLEHVKEEAPYYKRSRRLMCDLHQHRLRSLKIQRELGGKEIPLSVIVLSYKSN